MLNVNLYDKGIIDFYLGGPVKGERGRKKKRERGSERECAGLGESCFKVEVLMRRL